MLSLSLDPPVSFLLRTMGGGVIENIILRIVLSNLTCVYMVNHWKRRWSMVNMESLFWAIEFNK
jgi:hypothetical protein